MRNIIIKFIYPIGFLPPLIWVNEEAADLSDFSLRCLAVANFLLRLVVYPFNFLVNFILTVIVVVVATLVNILWCLGGFLDDSFGDLAKQLNQIAVTRCGWIIFDPIFFIWDQLKLFAGIFIPQYALETMKALHGYAHDLTDDLSNHLDLQELHFKRIRTIQEFLIEHKYHSLATMVGSLLAEPIETISFALRYPSGMDNSSLHDYGLNPEQLTAEQLQHPPTLFLHGDAHNSSGSLPLAKYLQQKNYPGAIFTVNYPTRPVTKESTAVILARIEEIKTYYQNPDFKINLIGHSRGCLMIYLINRDPLINKAILIGVGGPLLKKYAPDLTDGSLTIIQGKHDSFFPAPEIAKESSNPNRFFVSVGHLGALAHSETLEICHQRLTS